MKRTLVFLLFLLAGSSGCGESTDCESCLGDAASPAAASGGSTQDGAAHDGSAHDDDASVPLPPRPLRAQSFADCEAFSAAVREQAIRAMHRYVDDAERAPEQSCDQNLGSAVRNILPDEGISLRSGEGASAPRSFTDTNTQVRDIDEGDIVETDGRHLFVASQGLLRVLSAWPAAASRELAKVRFAGAVKQLILHEQQLIVLYAKAHVRAPSLAPRSSVVCLSCDGEREDWPSWIAILDVRNPAQPELVRELELSGAVAALRRIGSTVHAVVEDVPLPLHGVSVRIPRCVASELDRARRRDALQRYRSESEAAIRSANVLALLPHIHDSAFPDRPQTCNNIHLAQSGEEIGFTTLLSFDLAGVRPTTDVKLVDSVSEAYVSAESAYIAVSEGMPLPGQPLVSGGPPSSTIIHRVALGDDPARSRYEASGRVPGRLLNQFSMDEWQGHLRVATTVETVGLPQQRHNAVSVLAQREGELRLVGQLDRIAPREDIRSVRFMGARAYVVTFETIDPLFVLALEEPSAPRVLSELKVEGFSTYLHPLADGHLLTIGYEATGSRFVGTLSGIQLQLFDVRDPHAPRLAHKTVIGTRAATSPAIANHLAFTYSPEQRVLALPMSICEGGDTRGFGSSTSFAGLMLFDVDLASGIRERGRIPFPAQDMPPLNPRPGSPATSCLSSWSRNASLVQRGLLIDDFVYAIGSDQVKVRSLHALDADLAVIPLPADACTLSNGVLPHGAALPRNSASSSPPAAVCSCLCFDGTVECTDSLTRASCVP